VQELRERAELDAHTWRARAEAHAARVDRYTGPHLDRRRGHEKHPVIDFLFTYYNHRPAALRRWHPGFGVTLQDAEEYSEVHGYGVENGRATVAPEMLAKREPLLRQTSDLLKATLERQPSFGCFGLHEWAMVYQIEPSDIRHAAWPLRLGSEGTDDVVRTHRIACSHFDAFRFFTEPARPLNTLRPGRDDRVAFEQPGCLHANMDLYGKVAVRMSPLIPSELVMDAFELAWDARVIDMCAAPYDLTGLAIDPEGTPWTPIRIETAEGKAEYAALQREISERATPIRRALLAECELLSEAALAASSGST
jgi:hypothetical protein